VNLADPFDGVAKKAATGKTAKGAEER